MIRTVAETGSTNADLLADAATAPEGTWLRAERQSGGRGRLGRNWVSPAGNLYASTIVRLRPVDPPAPSLALVAGIALHETATLWAGGADLRLKWPNDLLVGSAKLAGILLERSGDAVIAGFGVNLACSPSLPDRPTISLCALAREAPNPAIFLEELAGSFERAVRSWRGRGLAIIREAWLAAAHPIDTPLSAGAGASQVKGLFAGLDTDGNMLLTLADGRRETINAGDVCLL